MEEFTKKAVELCTEGVTRAFGKAGFKAPAARIVTDK